MSYDICYDRCFIRSQSGITPMWLVGSNNCTETVWGLDGKHHERRERSWSPLGNMVGISEDELMSWANTFVPSTYNQHFKRGGKWVDDAGWIRFVENGIKKAATIEKILQYQRFGGISCKLSVWQNNPEKGYADKNWNELEQCVETTEEFDNWISSAKERVENRKDSENIYYCVRLSYGEPLKIPDAVDPVGKVVVKYNGQYVVGISQHGFSYCKKDDDAMIFDSVDDAKNAFKDYARYKVQYVSADGVLRRRKYKWAVKCTTSPYEGKYLSQRSAHKIRLDTAQYAKRFPTQAAADKYIAELRSRYKTEFEAVKL